MDPGTTTGDTPTLQELKDWNIGLVGEIFASTLKGGVLYNTNVFDADQRSPEIISSLSKFADIVLSGGDTWPVGFTFRNKNNVDIPLTPKQMIELASTMIIFINEVHKRSVTHKNAIAALVDDPSVRAYDVTTGWPTSSTDFSVTIDTSFISTRAQKVLTYALADSNNPFIVKLSTSYTAVARFVFQGSTIVSVPSKIEVIGSVSILGNSSIRLFDVTNSTVIAEVTGITSLTPIVIDLGTISNIPAGQSIFEIQTKGSLITVGSRISSVNIYF